VPAIEAISLMISELTATQFSSMDFELVVELDRADNF
jgi:hypothetical protein